ncbi:TIP41-like protein [Toxocara canis]|uniref:TIP41-like protein n=1 Tax=Toxocara canis TaxID=6265 RepID=A0A0B2V295_TOXCA|nr:TIP41-like protein [Toxocara canis]
MSDMPQLQLSDEKVDGDQKYSQSQNRDGSEPSPVQHVVDRSTAAISKAVNSAYAEQVYYFDSFIIRVTRDHILSSLCHHEDAGDSSSSFQDCKVCEYNAKLSLPHLPEMVFPNNVLMIQHSSRPYIKLYFSALDALKMVDATTLPEVQVGPSAVWQQSRLGGAPVNQLLNRFDWTYSTDYQGTVEGFEIEATNEAIDMEKLKRRDPIHFYSQIALYEDELADHGCAQLSVRIRVMPACFFLLSRFYLRVDGVMVRICDTRIYGEHCSGYFIREWSKREAKFTELSSTVTMTVGCHGVANGSYHSTVLCAIFLRNSDSYAHKN